MDSRKLDQAEIDLWTRLNECECVKSVFGNFLMRDIYYNTDFGAYGECTGDFKAVHLECIWLPHFSTPSGRREV